MTIADDLFNLIPVGEENAIGSSVLWRQLGKWAASSVRSQLHVMEARGLIQSLIMRRGENEIKLFFRPTLSLVIRMHPLVRRDRAGLGQYDHPHRRRC
jgi:hypothetical protein